MFVLLLFITVSVLWSPLLNCIIKTSQVTEDAGRLLSGADKDDAVIRWTNGRSLGTLQNAVFFFFGTRGALGRKVLSFRL
jgi:hypothetical protein